MRNASLLLLLLLPGCPSQPAPLFDSGSGHDAGNGTGDSGVDAAHGNDAGGDGGVTPADTGTDMGAAVDDAGNDAAITMSDAGSDAGNDAAVSMNDAGNDAAMGTDGGNACVNAGGMCVPLVPTACPGGTTGPESCGSGLGVECCHMGTTGTPTPVCMMTGTAQEGWYEPDGTLICVIPCAGLVAHCQRVGTASQGWYTTSMHGCPPHSTEILNDPNCVP